ncbi:MAG: hypothetical protein Q8M03_07770, partial [Legionella sp.]|nr:hypothetical protein [Legionella sp.]
MADRPPWLLRMLGDLAPANPTSVSDVHRFRLVADGDASAPLPQSAAIASWTTDVVVRAGDVPISAEVVVP